MDFTNLKFSFEIFKNLTKNCLLDFFIFKCYGTSMCDGKKLEV